MGYMRFTTYRSWDEIFCELLEFPMVLTESKRGEWSFAVESGDDVGNYNVI
jgi:hypothetical protein